VSKTIERRPVWRRWWLWATLVVLLGAGVAVFGWLQGQHRGRIAAGVQVMGVDVGGLTGGQALARLQASVARSGVLTAVLRTPDGGALSLPLERLGIRLDLGATVRQALLRGRTRIAGFTVYVGGGGTVTPVVSVLPGIYLEGLAVVRDKVDVPAKDASMRLQAGKLVVVPSADGQAVDDIALEHDLLAAVAKRKPFDGPVPTVVVTAAVSTADAQATAATADQYLARPVVLRLRGHMVKLTAAQMAPLLSVNTGDTAGQYPLTFDNPRAAAFLHHAFGFAERAARDATVAIRGKQAVIVPSVNGVAIDMPRLVADMDGAVFGRGGLRSVFVRLATVYPRYTAEALQDMGLSALGSEFTTYFDRNNAQRAANIARCAKLVDGTVVPAGHVFSLNETVGPRTLNRGFDYAPVIVDGVLMQGVGGGVCQFATTLFNAVFFAGLPVVERHPHQFAIAHYPLGRDAAVSWGSYDFRFRNDSGHALMVRSWADKDSLTVVIVGTTGRTVTYATSPMRQLRQPAHGQSNPRVVYDGTVSKGISRWESGAPGYAITVTRTVWANGTVLSRDSFASTYEPKDWIKRVGTRV
jgi:vancomycin resistance protein YoaR